MNPFFQLCIDNAATATVAGKRSVLVTNAAGQTIFVRGVIAPGYEANAADIVAAIDQADPTKDLNVHFNTPGGSVFEGKEIAAAIRNFPGKTIANIVSMCASAGTSIAVACTEVVMQKGAFFMIHNAQGAAFGDKAALRDTADLMEKIELSIVEDYTAKTGKPAEEVIAMMEAETWMTAAEALEHGFIDSIVGETAVSNAWNLSAYSKAPAALATAPAAVTAPASETAPEPAAASAPVVNSMAQANRNRLALIQATA